MRRTGSFAKRQCKMYKGRRNTLSALANYPNEIDNILYGNAPECEEDIKVHLGNEIKINSCVNEKSIVRNINTDIKEIPKSCSSSIITSQLNPRPVISSVEPYVKVLGSIGISGYIHTKCLHSKNLSMIPMDGKKPTHKFKYRKMSESKSKNNEDIPGNEFKDDKQKSDLVFSKRIEKLKKLKEEIKTMPKPQLIAASNFTPKPQPQPPLNDFGTKFINFLTDVETPTLVMKALALQ